MYIYLKDKNKLYSINNWVLFKDTQYDKTVLEFPEMHEKIVVNNALYEPMLNARKTYPMSIEIDTATGEYIELDSIKAVL